MSNDYSDRPDFSVGEWRSSTLVERALLPRGIPVSDSDELQRILQLPRRNYDIANPAVREALVEMMQRKLSLNVPSGQCKCARISKQIAEGKRQCITRLKWEQAFALYEIEVNGGLIANISVGGGKCSAAETEIFDYRTGRRRRVDEPGELDVATFDRTLRVAPATAFPSGEKPCVRVELADGTAITLSTDHPVLTTRGWIHAADLRPNTDFSAVAVELPEPVVETAATDDEVKFVAYMLSDGGCSQRTMGFTNMTPPVIDEWSQCATSLGYRVAERPSKNRARVFELCVGRTRNTTPGETGHYLPKYEPVRERWNLHGLAKNKRLHAELWGLPRRQVAIFLNRFWACDGHVSKRGVEITLASEPMVDDLRFMLLRLGVRSRKHYKQASYVKDGERHTFDAWRLSLRGESAQRFLSEVGDVLGKEDACRSLRANLARTPRNTNTDLVPIGPAEMDEIYRELGWIPWKRVPRDSWMNKCAEVRRLGVTQGQCLSRARFRDFCARTNYQGKYAHLATTDVAWERVESVTDAGTRPVYDLNVPGTHNFVANGVVIHNTALDILGPLMLRDHVRRVSGGTQDCNHIVLLVPPSLLGQIWTDYLLIREHYRVPAVIVHKPGTGKPPKEDPRRAPDGTEEPWLRILSYNALSGTKNSDILEQYGPNAIICDEVDALKDVTASRTLRLLRYFENHETTTRFCGWTGSLTASSIREFSHLSCLALRLGSPLPVKKRVIEEWSACLDAVPNPTPPGALIRLLEPGEGTHELRKALKRRMASTPGFIMIEGRQVVTTSTGERVELDIRVREAPAIPEIVDKALRDVRDWVRPDHLVGGEDVEILEDQLARARTAREVASGMMYRWIFPRAEPKPLRQQWYAARKAWHHELRNKVLKGEVQLDSKKLCENAAMRAWGHMSRSPELPEWKAETFEDWYKIRDQVKPQPKADVLDTFLMDDAAKWAYEHATGQCELCAADKRGGVIWYTMREFAHQLAKRARELYGLELPIYGEGSGDLIVENETGSRTIVASLKSHGRGRNGLQFMFHHQLAAQFPSSSRMVQQFLARLHRHGQQSVLARTDIYLHTEELEQGFDQAIRQSNFVEQLTGEKQKLLDGWEDRDLDDDEPSP